MQTKLILLLLVLSSSIALAQEARDFNVGAKIGTLGLGLDVSTPLNNKLSLRFNINAGSYTDTQDEDGTEFEGTLGLFTAGALLDYYPFENNFRLTSGLYYNGNNFTGEVKASNDVKIDINNKEYSVKELGSLDSDLTFNSIAPYLGLGWGNDAHDKGWGFTFDLGVMYHGKGQVALTPNFNNDNAQIQAEINNAIIEEERSIEDDLSSYQLFPVLSLGVNYTF